MANREKQLSFLLATSQYLIPAWDCTYEEAAIDLATNCVTVQKHGEWIGVRNGKGICSRCNRLDSIDPLATHCRYCGAKMDGERKGDDD